MIVAAAADVAAAEAAAEVEVTVIATVMMMDSMTNVYGHWLIDCEGWRGCGRNFLSPMVRWKYRSCCLQDIALTNLMITRASGLL